MSPGCMAKALAGVAAMMSTMATVAASSPAAAMAPAASAASAPHVSPYIRAAQQRAREASAAAVKVNPLMQHRPRVPGSKRNG